MARAAFTRGVMTNLGMFTLPARVDSADPVGGYADQMDAAHSMDINGRLRVFLSTGAGGAAQTVGVIPGVLANSVANRGTAAAPGALATIVTIAAGSLPAGTYDVQVQAYLSVAGTKNNMQFLRGATVVTALDVLAAAATVLPPFQIIRCVLDGATAITVQSIAADAAGTYEAQMIATRVA
jgi:hypothetical protein